MYVGVLTVITPALKSGAEEAACQPATAVYTSQVEAASQFTVVIGVVVGTIILR